MDPLQPDLFNPSEWFKAPDPRTIILGSRDMDPKQIALLYRLSHHPLTTINMTDAEIRAIRNLVRKGLAYDYADFYRRRTPFHLRVWGISKAGKTLLDQEVLSSAFTKRPDLDLGIASVTPRPPSKQQTKYRYRSPNIPEGLKYIPRYRAIRDKDKDKQP